MDGRTLVAGKADIPDLPRLPGLERRFHGAAGREDAIRVVDPNDLVKLQEVDLIGSEPAQRLINLSCGRVLVAAIDFGHQESPLAIAVAQRLAHANLALPAVVVPAVVEKVDSPVDRRAHDTNTLGLVEIGPDKVVSAQPH